MAEAALIALLVAGGSFGSAGLCYCCKKHSEFERVRFRCNYEDESCTLGFIHENTQLQQKLDEERKHIIEEKEREIQHMKDIYEKDVELLDKDNQLKIANLELAIRKKDDEIQHLNEIVADIRKDYVWFRERTNDMVFQNLLKPPSKQEMTSFLDINK